jgi:hypothetical protein
MIIRGGQFMKKYTGYVISGLIFLIFTLSNGTFAYGDSFTCSYGKKAACLDYSDKVCSSFAKCVNSDAICFNSGTCGYRGFICKSKFDGLVNDYDELADKYNRSLRNHNDVVDEYNDLQKKHSDLRSCVIYATTLDDAKNCY